MMAGVFLLWLLSRLLMLMLMLMLLVRGVGIFHGEEWRLLCQPGA
jgi:hypothetical protein